MLAVEYRHFALATSDGNIGKYLIVFIFNFLNFFFFFFGFHQLCGRMKVADRVVHESYLANRYVRLASVHKLQQS